MKNSLLIVLGLVSALSACTSTFQAKNADSKISGFVKRGLIEPFPVEISIDGKTYRGEWRTGAPTQEQRAATPIKHRRHIEQATVTLKADDGAELNCQLLSHGSFADGSCTGNGREYPVVLK